ncbi:MAG: Ig-like domain-containing protein, partial [Marinoscillum sp.]
FDYGIATSGYADGSNYYMAGNFRKTFYTSDNGASWTDVSTNKSGSTIYSDGDQIYQSGTDGIALSYDGGVTFKEINYNENRFSGSPGSTWEVICGEGDEVYVYKDRLYVSTDRGENFTTKSVIAGGVQGVADQLRSYDGKLYLASYNGLFISADKGNSFVRKTTANGLSSDVITSILKVNGVFYLTTTLNNVDRIEISTDNAESFTTISETALGSTDINNISVNQNGDIYVATPEGLRVSKDDGQTFELITTADGLGSNNVKNVQHGNDGAIYAFTDQGLTVLTSSSRLENSNDGSVNNALSGIDTRELTISNLTADLDQSKYYVKVTKENCEETSEVATLTVTDGAPSIDYTALSPANAEIGVSLTPEVSITLEESAQKGTGTIELRKSSDDQLVTSMEANGAQISISDDVATISLGDATLDPGTRFYFVVPTTAFTDGSGKEFVGINDKTSWSFVTNCDALLTDELTDQTAAPGENVSFSVDEIPGATYQWKKSVGGIFINVSDVDGKIEGAATRTLTLSYLETEDNGSRFYLSVITENCTVNTNNVQVNVAQNVEPLEITTTNPNADKNALLD